MFDTITQEEFDSKIQQAIIELNKFEPLHWMELASWNTDHIYLEMLKLKGINLYIGWSLLVGIPTIFIWKCVN
jgi:hypothetical protein